MANKLNPKISISEELLSSTYYDKNICEKKMNNTINHDPYEIFRNNTTAVEVIVKEVKHKGKHGRVQGTIIANEHKANIDNTTIRTLNKDIEKLRSELKEANSNLNGARTCFKVILCEMKKQLDAANQRELKTQTKNLTLQLEKEKLRTLLDSKEKLVSKLKKELVCIKQMLKMVVKGMRCSQPFPDAIYSLDAEYEEFEKDLTNSAFSAVAENYLHVDQSVGS